MPSTLEAFQVRVVDSMERLLGGGTERSAFYLHAYIGSTSSLIRRNPHV